MKVTIVYKPGSAEVDLHVLDDVNLISPPSDITRVWFIDGAEGGMYINPEVVGRVILHKEKETTA